MTARAARDRAVTASDIPQLGPRELIAVTAIAAGLTQEAAARRLGPSVRTLRRSLAAAIKQLDARSPAHAVALAAASGQLDWDAILHQRLPAWPEASARRDRDPYRRKRVRFAQLLDIGMSVPKAARAVGVSHETGYRWRNQLQHRHTDLRAARDGDP